ncbi:Hypothetical predicted protein [Paramuricea clavata]|uniref:Uncharacterized protein n=1 Tax=Paramuricea clavata TaxID=317549 RepID=A0A7D9ERL7_PARCT|nr:Hypothetical predicted protein [Paramuricea clavata]
METVRSIVMSVVFVWMSNFVEITNVVKVLHMMNVAFIWSTRCPICRESFAHKLERRPLPNSRTRSGK